ncbi:MAG: dephospho-CoA kinase, partial [Phycisphaerales bacterium]
MKHDDQEREILRLAPSWFSAAAVFAPFIGPALFLLAAWAVLKFVLANNFPPALTISSWMIGISLVLGVLFRWSRGYTLTNRRITAEAGLLRRARAEVPLRNVQHLMMTRGIIERLTGSGTIAVSSAGSDGPVLSWIMVPDPEAVLKILREAVDLAQGEAPTKVPVVGLVGGIGSGKSAVAKALAELNFLVIDADADARAVLSRPEIVAKLVEWWGSRVLDAAGGIDRKAVGEIVFADPAERRRLESLVHPLVKADRQGVVRRAREGGFVGVVIDAPLLFEAGSNVDCDHILFVDAPRETREARVKSRGWAEGELAKREAAQLPLDEKRARSSHVIVNDG